MNVGDRVSFLRQYGSPVLRIFKDEYRYVYRKRRVYGVVEKILKGEGFPDIAFIRVDGDSYQQGVPMSKVASEVAS